MPDPVRDARPILLTAVLLSALAAGPAPAAAPPSYKAALIAGVPHVRQKPDFCGEACVEMALRRLGHAVTQDQVYNVSGENPLAGRGCVTASLACALKTLGFRVGEVWYKVGAHSAADLEAQWAVLHADLLAGIPTIVCMRTGATPEATEHFRLVLGYDPRADEVIYHEPAEDRGAYRRMARAAFLDLWPLRYGRETWTVIRLRLEPGRIADPPAAGGFTDADYVQHLMDLKRKVPAEGFTIVLQKPFVVIGNDSPERVKAYAEGTVQWATARLKKLYFARDPADIIDIWLFRDAATYRRYAREVFGDDPTTPFGYSSEQHKALIMNIATGGGTLVHEIVHPFIGANFPDCPAWLNEGLGSLYEQSSSDGDRIIGLTNWRLEGLQDCIRRKALPSFRTLTGTTVSGFYHDDPGSNYAQARYLCYYLQEKGLLVPFYHAFLANRAKDPTGYETLKTVLKESDMAAFQKRWESFVLALRFP